MIKNISAIKNISMINNIIVIKNIIVINKIFEQGTLSQRAPGCPGLWRTSPGEPREP